MDRYTEYHCGTAVIKDKLKTKGAIERLATYEDLEEQGLLLKLPCKIGDMVYKIIQQKDTFDDMPYKIVTATCFDYSMIDKIGRTVFLTQEEAGQALQGRGKDK